MGRLSPLLLSQADNEDRPLCLLWLGEWGLLGAAPAPLGTDCLFAEIPSHSCSLSHPRMDEGGGRCARGGEEEIGQLLALRSPGAHTEKAAALGPPGGLWFSDLLVEYFVKLLISQRGHPTLQFTKRFLNNDLFCSSR